MKTKVGLTHEPKRKLPWMVYWFGEPDPETGRQRKRTKCFQYNREAREFQTAKQAELDQGGPRAAFEDVTLGRLLDEFEKARVSGLSHSSKVCYGNTISQLREYFGNHRPIRLVSLRHAEAFMATRKRRDARPGKLSGHAMKQHATYCRAVFDAAIEWGWYKSNNPFRPPKQKRNTPLRIKASSRPWHHLTPAEFERMLAVVPSVKRRAAFWLMCGAGLRPGEVYNLTIDRVDLANRCVHIANRGATDDIPPFVVKCDDLADESKERTVPIPEAAIADVTSACQEAFKSGGFLALTPERFAIVQRKWRLTREGKRVWRGNRDMLNNLLRDTKGYLRKAEIKLSAPFTLTTLRKSYAQNHADAGTPPKTLAELMGHSDVQVTLKYYARVTDSNKRAAADTVNRLFSKGRGHEVATS